MVVVEVRQGPLDRDHWKMRRRKEERREGEGRRRRRRRKELTWQVGKNETVGNSTRTRSETEMKPVRKNLKTTQKL